MKYALITGSNGLVGSEAVDFFIKKKFKIIAIDNNFRRYFFGKNAAIWNKYKKLPAKGAREARPFVAEAILYFFHMFCNFPKKWPR